MGFWVGHEVADQQLHSISLLRLVHAHECRTFIAMSWIPTAHFGDWNQLIHLLDVNLL